MKPNFIPLKIEKAGRIHALKDLEPIQIQQEEIRILNLLNFEIQIRSRSASMQLHFVHFNEYFDKHHQWVWK